MSSMGLWPVAKPRPNGVGAARRPRAAEREPVPPVCRAGTDWLDLEEGRSLVGPHKPQWNGFTARRLDARRQ